MSILSVLNTAFNAPSHMISRPFVGFCRLFVLIYAHNFFTTCGRESEFSWTSAASGSLSCDEITYTIRQGCEAYDTPQIYSLDSPPPFFSWTLNFATFITRSSIVSALLAPLALLPLPRPRAFSATATTAGTHWGCTRSCRARTPFDCDLFRKFSR